MVQARHPYGSRHPRLLDQVREVIRIKRYSIRTEEAYVQWIKRFILFHGKRHPRDMGPEEIRQFLTHLAMTRRVAASTQNQALSAILFLYKAVLQQDIGWVDEIVWAKKPKRLPVVSTREEVKAVLQRLSDPTWLMASLLYGAGLRLNECLRLRVKDVDVSYHQITVRDGKGAQDRVAMLPERLKESLQAHLHTVQQLHQRDLEDGFGNVYLPDALARKYPNASREWAWQYVFPAARRSRDPRSGTIRRHHVMPLVLQRAVKAAVRQTGIAKAALSAQLRHPFAGKRRRHSHGAGTLRAQRCQDHDDVYACVASGWTGNPKPAGWGVTAPVFSRRTLDHARVSPCKRLRFSS